MKLVRLNEEAKTYLYGCEFYLAAGVTDLNDAQDFLDEDFDLMLDLFNEDINATDNPIINWRWYLTNESSGYFIYETNRELTKKELENLGEGTTGQAADGLGEGFEQQEWACYTVYYDEYGDEVDQWDDYEEEEEVMASFNWQKDYVIRPLSHAYRKYLK